MSRKALMNKKYIETLDDTFMCTSSYDMRDKVGLLYGLYHSLDYGPDSFLYGYINYPQQKYIDDYLNIPKRFNRRLEKNR